ncbi:hypothetical protein SDC9_155249 [bioreactor metagenome]|uniref:Bro-N domain-containing protein n=1 Tax=bioreactor metagenome TaxID=1076179 RepID=A0A645F662_9ZZZZ
MLDALDDDEKLTQTMFVSGQNRNCWFLTENGLYEVLMLSLKPIVKQIKRASSRLSRRLDDDEKGARKTCTLGGEQKMTIINESGPYLPNWRV